MTSATTATTAVQPAVASAVLGDTATPAPPGATTPARARQDRKSRPLGADEVPIGDTGWDVPLPAPHQTPPHVDRDDLVRQLQQRGWVNGQLGALALVDVDGCVMIPPAASAWRTMKAAAAADGVILGASQCYRSIGGQVAARDNWCAADDCQYAAQPGRSLHGWGLAVDVTAGNHTIDFGSREYAWLVAHGPEYGFYHPDWADPTGDAPEPWHFEYQGPI